ncbi:hypothetical protein BB558_004448 [Smittium angustum]|uniref:Uncharacterized protein n=1 Tax=Smittium angustum TaxID=133377 RepID=A0A2U1J385_SMIAN|nr:hypothetical protein BB558_004448 [Smittium angustum]
MDDFGDFSNNDFGEFEDFDQFQSPDNSLSFEDNLDFPQNQYNKSDDNTLNIQEQNIKDDFTTKLKDIVLPMFEQKHESNIDIKTIIEKSFGLAFQNIETNPKDISSNVQIPGSNVLYKPTVESLENDSENLKIYINEAIKSKSGVENIKIDFYDLLTQTIGIDTQYTTVLNRGYESLRKEKSNTIIESTRSSLDHKGNAFNDLMGRKSDGEIKTQKKMRSESEDLLKLSDNLKQKDFVSSDKNNRNSISRGDLIDNELSLDMTIDEIRDILERGLIDQSKIEVNELERSLICMNKHLDSILNEQKILEEGTATYNQVIHTLIGQAEKLKIESSASSSSKKTQSTQNQKRGGRFSFLTKKTQETVVPQGRRFDFVEKNTALSRSESARASTVGNKYSSDIKNTPKMKETKSLRLSEDIGSKRAMNI